jgi:hypothetical protein
VANFLERALLRSALAANPQISTNLRSLVQSISGNRFTEHELLQIEQNLVDVLTVAEAMSMPTSLPPLGLPLKLNTAQLATLHAVSRRFSDLSLGIRMSSELSRAVESGYIQIQS